MAMILQFNDQLSEDHALVGGKGANLGRMTKANFPVPPGFTVTTKAYEKFIADSKLSERIAALLGTIDYSAPVQLEEVASEIREEIKAAPIPKQVFDKIAAAYAKLEGNPFVAVRSSGTAEDLAGASFAGLHDTYLDIRGAEDVADAVKACWASLYSGRAVAYRQDKGFDSGVKMAVVIQIMVQSDVSGVMFTGNPLTSATDEIVINASWGLGEAVVQGIVSPDQYTLKIGTLRVKEKIAGVKAVEIVRAPNAKGTIERRVEADRQKIFSLSEANLLALGDLGRRVMTYYDELPQDIEWAIASGEVYLLQTRPITGVDFSWDADVNSWQPQEENDDDVWLRTHADDMWTGAITPLMFSWRGQCWSVDYRDSAIPLHTDPDLAKPRFVKYFRGEAYINLTCEKIFVKAAPPASRTKMAQKLPPNSLAEVLNTPFRWLDYAKMLLRGYAVRPPTGLPYGWMRALDNYFANRLEEAIGLPKEKLPTLSDAELSRYIRRQIKLENEYNVDLCWPGLFIYCRDAMTALELITTKWYDGPNKYAFAELVAGTEKTTATVREHIELYDMSRIIRNTPELQKRMSELSAEDFFRKLGDSDAGKTLSDKVASFLEENGHRGHSDRDIIFPRYADDPGLLFRALAVHAKSDDDPRKRETENNRRRATVLEDVEQNLRRKDFGFFKAELFKIVYTYVMRFLEYRDDERQYIDRNTYSIRQGFQEMNRRIRERGHLNSDRDFWFLTESELKEVLSGRYNKVLTDAKVAARMRNFDRFNNKEYQPPKFLQRDRELRFDEELSHEEDGATLLKGLPTSRGRFTGTARVVKRLDEIGRVNPGEILVANSTDPGWTPVFAVISAVVVETGGLLSHSSCLAREYGFPAAQIEGAVQLIPDGATITVDGDAGQVRVHRNVEEALS